MQPPCRHYPADVDNGSSDACGIAPERQPDSFTCAMVVEHRHPDGDRQQRKRLDLQQHRDREDKSSRWPSAEHHITSMRLATPASPPLKVNDGSSDACGSPQ